MLKSLDCLSKSKRSWSPAYGVAQSRIGQHSKASCRKASIHWDSLSRRNDYLPDRGAGRLSQDELSKRVMVAMKQIREKHRAILSLRCYERLSYSDIGMALHCNGVMARVLFFRAKQALKKQLGRQGLSKSLMSAALELFGRLTAPDETSPRSGYGSGTTGMRTGQVQLEPSLAKINGAALT
ncbi:MAG: hypothetical protein ABIF19_11290 [Planctomycetota bacterium]